MTIFIKTKSGKIVRRYDYPPARWVEILCGYYESGEYFRLTDYEDHVRGAPDSLIHERHFIVPDKKT